MPDRAANPAPPAAAPARRRWRVAMLAAALVVAALVAAGNLYVLSITRGAIVGEVADAPPRPVALILGNFVSPEGTPSWDLAWRLETGRALYAAGRVGRLIVSGMVRDGYDEPHPMAAWLVARGVPASDIVIDVLGHRTAASMAAAASSGFHSLLVVTQAYHLPRALYFARRAGIDAVGVAAPYRGSSSVGMARTAVRETLARAEAVLEVALRGVRG
jgi:vancomycin permeability regulator SanA